ncbi:hypothetical protein F4861DRAFT_3208 [Xylaria intraflava]|nr:hypothetical protein F4861DRAFT_3208 [Xylaria intraflava]
MGSVPRWRPVIPRLVSLLFFLHLLFPSHMARNARVYVSPCLEILGRDLKMDTEETGKKQDANQQNERRKSMYFDLTSPYAISTCPRVKLCDSTPAWRSEARLLEISEPNALLYVEASGRPISGETFCVSMRCSKAVDEMRRDKNGRWASRVTIPCRWMFFSWDGESY